jgi:hypothetical protein
MASGNTLITFTPLHNQPPASNYAVLGSRNGHATLEYDAGTAWAGIFGGVLPRHYAGGGITVTLVWMAASATTGNVVWKCDVERHQDGTDDLDADSFDTASAQSATAAVPSTSGVVKYTTLAFTNSQIDGLAAGESFRFRVQRDAAHASDTAAGNAQLLRVELRET